MTTDMNESTDVTKIVVDVEDFSDMVQGDSVGDKINTAIASDTVVVFGRTTCPFCIEVTRTMMNMGVAFRYYKLDKMEGEIPGTAVLEELKSMTGQKTVPFVYINGRLIGGCNDTKASIASGEFDMLLGEDGDVEGQKVLSPLVGVDQDAPNVIGALFEFPNTVDGRVIRWTGFQVFVICVIIAALSYQEKRSIKWLSVGLLTDFCLRLYGGAGISPLGSLAMFTTAVWDFVGPAATVRAGLRARPRHSRNQRQSRSQHDGRWCQAHGFCYQAWVQTSSALDTRAGTAHTLQKGGGTRLS